MADPCYSGPNPIDDEDRAVIWKWVKEHGGVDDGFPIEHVGNSINQTFFDGMAKPEWIDDILSGRKTPFRSVATDMWKKQYNRRVITQQAQEISKLGAMGKAGKTLRLLWTLPRSVAVAGHGIVFPFTHAGDLAFRPASWGQFIAGTLRTYRAAPELWGLGSKLGGGKAYAARQLSKIARDKLPQNLQGIIKGDSFYDFGLRSAVDMGAKSRPAGLISRTYIGPAQRAWDMLTVMRYYLWKKQVLKFIKPGMSEAEALDIGKNLSVWANHATGSAEGLIAKTGDVAFGPKLTQSKISRLTTDPAQTIKTFANWDDASVGEKAVAWTRLSGATQYALTNLGFLGVNAGLLYALKSKDKINISNPFHGDFMSFKGNGLVGNMPGLHTEVKFLASLLATAFASSKPANWYPDLLKKYAMELDKSLPEQSKFKAAATLGGQYGMAKLTPAIQRGMELGFGQDWRGRPLPYPISSEKFGKNKYGKDAKYLPQLTPGEYAADIGPIPLSGPIGYVYDQTKGIGMSALDSTKLIKALIITGLGLPGLHVREDFFSADNPKPSTQSTGKRRSKLGKF